MQMAFENVVGKGDKRTKMVQDCSPEFLRRHSPIFLVAFREEFPRISLCLYSAIKTPFTNTMLTDRSKFCKQFLERVTQGTFL